jgi:hypothetical protein
MDVVYKCPILLGQKRRTLGSPLTAFFLGGGAGDRFLVCLDLCFSCSETSMMFDVRNSLS